jgi:hypothetical protein
MADQDSSKHRYLSVAIAQLDCNLDADIKKRLATNLGKLISYTQLIKSLRHADLIVFPEVFIQGPDGAHSHEMAESIPNGAITQALIKLAKENSWGYARIVGELKKLRIYSISKSTVRNILKEYGLDPCPKRSGSTWDEFLSRHAASLWQADFLSQKVLTVKGIRDAFILVFLHVETRRVGE